jgi:DNA-binding NtrC family response regulator
MSRAEVEDLKKENEALKKRVAELMAQLHNSPFKIAEPVVIERTVEVPSLVANMLEDYPNMSIWEIEKQYVLKALKKYEGNKTKAAKALGITVKTLYNKLHEYEVMS